MPQLAERDTPGRGLVLCAISATKPSTSRFSGREFPSPDLVGMAAATVAASSAQVTWAGQEGPRWFLIVSPGSVRISSHNLSKGQRSAERAVKAHRDDVDGLVSELLAGKDAPGSPAPSREILAWSRKSRANMVRRLVTLDYNPMLRDSVACMVTLTYPGQWLCVAPNGRAVKGHLRRFQKRYWKRWGVEMPAVWKLEFQRRGAPHFHLFTVIPPGCSDVHEFRLWVAKAWSEVIDHPDPEQRRLGLVAGTGVDVYEASKMTDPKRVAVYFTKHGLLAGKEYQNQPPQEWKETGSVGRFWGYWQLRPVEVPVEVTPTEALAMARTLRRWQHSTRYLRKTVVNRPQWHWQDGELVERAHWRTVRRPVRRMQSHRGFLSVNDGPSVAMMLDRLLGQNQQQNRPEVAA